MGVEMENGASSLIRLEGVTKVFVTDEVETHALSGIHLEVKKGEYVSIAGPSGCGKSTLLAILGLLDTPTDGDYCLNGRPVSGLKLSRAGAHPQPRDRLHLPGVQPDRRPHGVRERGTAADLSRHGRRPSARSACRKSLERVGMSHRMKHYPSQLSGGQQQRVAVARALAGDPLILLADEPTGNLDSANGEAVMNLLRELHRNGATICMVTHDPRYAKWADRTIHLFDGRIVEESVEEAVSN